ncbi:hypothetical protein [Caenispirillum salinarum]|uniref:hypothetical protein n=1 Tax=Caenispirillum salinarum TaxID=859058 RepID=UPI00384DE06B
MQAILYDRLNIAEIVKAPVLPPEEAPQGYGVFGDGAAAKFVLDLHGMPGTAA